MRENAAAKARRYVTEGRLVLEHVTAAALRSTCRGDGALHRQAWTPAAGWSCSCPASSTACAHLQAVRLVVAVDLPPAPYATTSTRTETR